MIIEMTDRGPMVKPHFQFYRNQAASGGADRQNRRMAGAAGFG
jgi:hypothetical protein